MPHPSHRLDLQLVPTGEGSADRVTAALAGLLDRAVVDARGAAGAEAGWLVSGGFARVRADRWERPRLWANQQGGFRARCPDCAESVVRSLHAALAVEGAEPVRCGVCGWSGHLALVDFQPTAAWGPSALVVHDAQDAQLTVEAAEWVASVFGEYTLVWRRP